MNFISKLYEPDQFRAITLGVMMIAFIILMICGAIRRDINAMIFGAVGYFFIGLYSVFGV